MLGAAALITEDRAEEANTALATLAVDNGAPSVHLLQLLTDVDGPNVDLMFQRALLAPVQDIIGACQLAKVIEPDRRRRMAVTLIDWIQRALATVPVNQLPKLEDIRKNAPAASMPEPTRSVICVINDAVSLVNGSGSELRRLAAWLDAQPADFYVFLGALVYAETGDLRPLKRLAETTDTQDNPKRMELLKSLEDEYQRKYRELKAAESSRTQAPQPAT